MFINNIFHKKKTKTGGYYYIAIISSAKFDININVLQLPCIV